MSWCIDATDKESLARAFGTIGLDLTHFPSRAARHRSNNGLDEELYILRRYLFSMEHEGMLVYPLHLSKSETPDFIGHTGQEAFGIEVTEATTAADQRGFTLSERSNQITLLGSHGDRYAGGLRYDGNSRGRLEDRDFVADILRAIRRKRSLGYPDISIQLLLYPNSNASLMSNLCSALPMITARFDRWIDHLISATKIRKIAIVCDSERKLIVWTSLGGLKVCELFAECSER